MELDEYSARPIAYFSHDANAHDDIKHRKLMRRAGVEGYGRFWLLCELLASIDGHCYRTQTEDDWELLADTLHLDTVNEAREFIELLQELLLLHPDAQFVYSDRMNDTARAVGAMRKGGTKGNTKRWKAK